MSELDLLSKWFSKRPQWLQIAAKRLLEKDEITTKDISELALLCLQEAEGTFASTNYSFPKNAFSQNTTGSLRLCSIGNIEGVNALAPKVPLKFGKGISVIYGLNASGKSGYVRLLKQICGARNPGDLHRNVYVTTPHMQQNATITFKKNGAPNSYEWAGQGVCDDLNSVDIFDTSLDQVFINSEDKVSYEPPILSFFSSLIDICGKVAEALDAEINQNPSKKPNMPNNLKLTTEGVWFENINFKTTQQDVEKYCSFESKDETEVQNLQQRLAEPAPVKKANELRKQKSYADYLIQDAQKHLKQLSDENIQRIIAAKKKSILMRKAAEAAAQNVFNDGHLKGIGIDVWKELWEAARKYSVTVAYKDTKFPNVSEESRCVLCHQPLSEEAKARLLSFEDFVKGEMEKTAVDAAKEYESIMQTVEDIPTSDSLQATIDAAGIQQDQITTQITEFFSQLQVRKDQLPKLESEDSIPTAPHATEWIGNMAALSKDLRESAEKYEADAKTNNRDQVKESLDILLAKQWLADQREAILDEIKRLKLLNQIQDAKKTTNTKSLSQKKGELAQELITNAFVKRFNKELKVLRADHIKVELIKSKVTKGHVLHKLQLRSAPQNSLGDVLSEGEKRIISIAAFLADVTGEKNKTPFIFDDPISSLDQTYEESVVKRLIDLSQDRQVIIFTHRLSLLGTVKFFTEKKDIKPDVVSIRSADWGTGEPSAMPLAQSDIKSALNILINQHYQKTKKASDNGEFDKAEIYLKSMCSDFRTLVERSIENDLLCGVVQRFQRPVHTLKLKDLKKLKIIDLEFLDSLMTKYSGFEHSQPAESPIELPRLDEIHNDMTELKNWRDQYLKRSATTTGM